MVMVEMAFQGTGGLDQLVSQTADAVECVLAKHSLAWHPGFPVTLRESLCLGLQQQMVARGRGMTRVARPGSPVYRVLLGLPPGGLRAWTNLLTVRILAGCKEEGRVEHGPVWHDLQACLVEQIGPWLQRLEGESLSKAS